MNFVVYKSADLLYNDLEQQTKYMLTRVEEMITELHSHANAKSGFTAKEVYEIGKTYGLTCREIGQNFLGKSRSIGYSRYLPQNLSAEVILAGGPKKRGRKPGSKVVAKLVNPAPDEEANAFLFDHSRPTDVLPYA